MHSAENDTDAVYTEFESANLNLIMQKGKVYPVLGKNKILIVKNKDTQHVIFGDKAI